MLFGVKYKSLEIERLQNALLYFFQQLESGNTVFDENLFPLEFRPYLYVRRIAANGYKLYVTRYFQPMFDSFLGLSVAERAGVINSITESNKIEAICSNIANPTLFEHLPASFRASIRGLRNLYEELSDIIQRETDIDAFKSVNGSICSTCGSYTVSHLDHYLPKGGENPLYILSAINPRNLISTCTTCNQGKASKLIIFDNNLATGNRVVVFSPYENIDTWEFLNIKLRCTKKPTASNSGEWLVTISLNRRLNASLTKKIKRWKTFYELERRFAKEIRININLWVKSFEAAKSKKNETLQGYITSIHPTKLSIIQAPNIILQSRFFTYLNENKRIRNQFLKISSTAQDPNELLAITGLV